MEPPNYVGQQLSFCLDIRNHSSLLRLPRYLPGTNVTRATTHVETSGFASLDGPLFPLVGQGKRVQVRLSIIKIYFLSRKRPRTHPKEYSPCHCPGIKLEVRLVQN